VSKFKQSIKMNKKQNKDYYKNSRIKCQIKMNRWEDKFKDIKTKIHHW